MGEVYKARDTRLDRTVAIKVLPEHVASDPDLQQRFEREAKTISSLTQRGAAKPLWRSPECRARCQMELGLALREAEKKQ